MYLGHQSAILNIYFWLKSLFRSSNNAIIVWILKSQNKFLHCHEPQVVF